MIEWATPTLTLFPFSKVEFDLFVEGMLTDPRLVEFFYAYKAMNDVEQVRKRAERDFWAHFTASRSHGGLDRHVPVPKIVQPVRCRQPFTLIEKRSMEAHNDGMETSGHSIHQRFHR